MDYEKEQTPAEFLEWLSTFHGPKLAARLQTAADLLRSASTPPEGWKLVPVEPTFEMWDHAENESMFAEEQLHNNDPEVCKDAFNFPTHRIWNLVVGYRAMLSASPSPPEKG